MDPVIRSPRLEDEVKRLAQEQGFATCGIASAASPQSLPQYREWLAKGYHGQMDYLASSLPLREDPATLLPGARSAIMVTLGYYQEPPPGPKVARYALGRDYHKVLRAKLRRLAAALEEAQPDARFRACVDSAPILEREYAHRAGLGWFGKNTMLIDSKRGSWFFLGALLTTLELEPDKPSLGGCGTCRACIDACPTGAIVHEDGRWQVDARRCISYLTIEHRGPIDPELDAARQGWVFGCDVCQEVCPFNHPTPRQPLRALPTAEPDFVRRPLPSNLEELSQEEWDLATRGTAIRRAGFEGLKRNARLPNELA